LGYVFLSIMKPAEGSNEFLIAGGVLLFVGIGTVVFTAVFLRLQGAVHVNEVKSMIEVFKGLGLSTRVHTLRFHTLEKMVLKSPAASRLRSDSPPPNVASDQIVIYLKTGEEIKLAFARLNRQQGLQVVKEIAELAGIPAFDGKGQPLRESRAVTPHSG
ncbi:MAG: hypothetical protein GWM98_25460, partial [Nitrospinaceae bacterium]|nr:hypothetical protein [Nitrospinaceae bacterium]NIR57208.1 hypothetical protein [Nitrospinaceae bacterium]NIT84517.1 hypothetical protein [Nitrospinaceae bacterium]NIU46708.1 hypothetical protein [Nitrospinaceae bacterium]NIU98901.1 hypothetical protein [Nitrospinaceae bacterium]